MGKFDSNREEKKLAIQMLLDKKSIDDVLEVTHFAKQYLNEMYWAVTRCHHLIHEMQKMRDNGYTLRDIQAILDVGFTDAQLLTVGYTKAEKTKRLNELKERERAEKKEQRKRLLETMQREEPKGGVLPDFLKGIGTVKINSSADKRIAGVPDITMETRKEKQCHSNQYFIRKNGIYGGV